MEKALEGYFLQGIIGIEVSAGNFETDDWIWLQSHTWYLGRLEKFEVTGGIGNVANIPNTTWWDGSYFSIALKELHVAKLKRVGGYALQGLDRLTSVSLPAATEIGERAFSGCSKLASLELRATPPSVESYAFLKCPLVRKLKLLDAGGSPLMGDALANAISRYRAVEDGDTEDNLWYVWAFENAPASNLSGTIEGDAFANAASLEAAMKDKDLSKVKEVTITGGWFQLLDWLFLLEKGQQGLAIEKFTIESSVDRVADMPDLPDFSPQYLPKVQKVSIAKLKRVGKKAFIGCTGLTSVSLPVATKIGNEAFGSCTGLTSVSLPVAIEIGDRAFYGCAGLTSLELGATPPSVGRDAFLGCPLVRRLVLIDANETPLEKDALANAKSKYKAEEDGDTEDNLWYVWAFEDAPASNLSGSIDGETFSGAASLEAAMKDKDLSKVKEVTITGGRFQLLDWLFLLEKGQRELAIETLTVESSVNRVADMPDLPYESARYLPKAQKVSIAKLNRVGEWAFYDCRTLTSVSLPTAIVIGKGAFSGSTGLTRVSLSAATEIGYRAFSGCEALTSISLPAATEIGWSAFEDCKGLTSVSLPAATKIDWSAFKDCKGLTSVSLPAATLIGEDAFNGCTGLTSVSLPVATEIGSSAFYGCTGLTSVSLPVAIVIGDRAFYGCAGLTSLELGATPPSVKLNAFLECPLVRKLKLLDADGTPLTGDALINAISRYRAVEDGDTEDNLWYGWAFEEAPAGNLSGTIDGEAFSNAASLKVAMKGKDLSEVKDVTITGGRFQLLDWLFLLEKGQRELAIETFTVESSMDRVADMPDLPYKSARYLPKAQKVSIAMIQKIGSYAFYRCTGLTSVSLPAAIEIGEDAFRSCEALTSVSLPVATKISNEAFYGCTGLTNVSLPAATEIRKEAFYGCTGLTSVSLPAATMIVGATFRDCKGLTSVSLPAATLIGWSAFRDCKGLTSVSLPAATLIDEDAFNGCTGLTSVSLPAATKIRKEAFYGCTGLTSLQLGATPPRVGSDVFVGCPGVRTLIITDATGVALVGAALSTAANAYDGDAGDPIDGKWQGFAIEMNPPTLLLVKIVPSGAGTVKITRKKDGATVNQSDVLTKGDALEVQAEPKNGYRVKAITAEGAKRIGDKEWEVSATSGEVTFTVEFEKAQEENSNNDPTPVESVLLAQARLFPNPTGGQVTIDAGTTIARCEVYSSTGALLQAIEAPENAFTIDLTASPLGVYLVRLVDMQGGSKTLRVVKQ